MAMHNQAWEILAEDGRVLTDQLSQLTKQGVNEYDVLVWLANYRQKQAEDEHFQSDEAEADHLTIAILADTAKEWDRVASEAIESGTSPKTPTKIEISEDDIENELNRVLFPLCEDGFDEIDILRWFAIWREQISTEENRSSFSTVDVQLAQLLHDAMEKLETALDEWAEADPFDVPAPILPIRREGQKIGRNDPCPCGSEKKFKKCHGKN